MKCKKGYEVEPQRSAAGYYLGTVNAHGCPKCRLSLNYERSKELASANLQCDRMCASENVFCNRTGDCFDESAPANIIVYCESEDSVDGMRVDNVYELNEVLLYERGVDSDEYILSNNIFERGSTSEQCTIRAWDTHDKKEGRTLGYCKRVPLEQQ